MKVVKNYSQNLVSGGKGVVRNGRFYAFMLNIIALLKEFYSLQAIEAGIKYKFGMHSHDKWLSDFLEYKTWFESKFSEMLHDYICLICLAEMRHSSRYSNKGIRLENYDFTSVLSRYDIYAGDRIFTKDSILHMASWIFNPFNNEWRENYGGYSWYMIANAGLMYQKEPNTVFIDHCFDLQHNGGQIFDKQAYLFSCPDSVTFNNYLDEKRDCNDIFKIMKWAQTKESQQLIERAVNIGILDYNESRRFFLFDFTEQIISISTSRNNYINHFYYDNNRLMNNLEGLDLSDFMELYHPYHWGSLDMVKEAIIFNTGKKYEEGYNTLRDIEDDDNVSGY